MRDVPSGWLLRYIHANGASLFFIVVYLHIFKGFFYSSYARPREALWILGVVILLLMIMTAFIGYEHSQKSSESQIPKYTQTIKKKIVQVVPLHTIKKKERVDFVNLTRSI